MRWIFIALLFGACDPKVPDQDDDDTAGDSGGSDLDGDDSGGDDTGIDDTGGDADTDTDADIDCDEDLTVDPDTGPDCVVQTLECGDSIVDSTEFGTASTQGADYQAWFCAIVGAESYSGKERVYRFEHPGDNQTIRIALDSPCGELDLFAANWSDDTCPTAANSILECEGDIGAGGAEISIFNSEVRTYLIYVDGPAGEEVNFGLSIDCD